MENNLQAFLLANHLQQILTTCWDLEEAGWTDDARSLRSDLNAAQNLPELLMVRDDAERLADQLQANQ